MQKPDIPFCFKRLAKSLPLYDASRLAYVKSKFIWLVCDFSEEYFGMVDCSLRTKIIDNVFDAIAIHHRRLEINTIDKLLTCVANLYVRLMKRAKNHLIVSNDFFLTQFVLNFKSRFQTFDCFIEKNYECLYSKLKEHGVDDVDNVLGVALDLIEEKMIHPVNETNFISDWILNIVTICNYNGIVFSPATFLGR